MPQGSRRNVFQPAFLAPSPKVIDPWGTSHGLFTETPEQETTTMNPVTEIENGARGATSTLEALQMALSTINPETFKFSSWSFCTCGHIYLAAAGQVGGEEEVLLPQPEESVYCQALQLVVRANRAELEYLLDELDLPTQQSDAWARLVSTATTLRACQLAGLEFGDRPPEHFLRLAAEDLISNAIEFEKARQEKARLQVLAQAGITDPAHEFLVA